MKSHSKRYRALAQTVATKPSYSIAEAIILVKQAVTKFDGTVELHAKLGIDTKKSDQNVRGSVQLPYGAGKVKRIIAFVGTNKEAEAKAAGADIIGNKEMIQELKQTGKINFDVAVATPDMMKQLAPIARLLGQKGLMPNPKTETVGTDISKIIKAVKAGKINFKNDTGGNIHLAVGKVSFTADQLMANVDAVLEAVRKAKPPTAKGIYLKRLILTSTMGPGLQLYAG